MDAESSLDDDLIGTIAGGYRILSRVGSGTMGHVYEAEAEGGGRVALKVLHRHQQEEFAQRFLREGKTLALLSHPNIVTLVAMGQLDDGALYLATELVDGPTLRAIMDQGPVEPVRALTIVRQILDALDAAHALGVVHRDMKPENVVLDTGNASETVKVLDFGVAKLLADTVAGLGEANLTSAGFSVFGSALYIAPEAVTGQKIDGRLDLYSVGAMLYEMVAGRPPFDHEDPVKLLHMHAFDPAPTLQQGAPGRTFTPELESLVARALAKRPEQRFLHAAEMIAAVDAALVTLRPPVRAVHDAAAGNAARAPRARTQVVRLTPRRKLIAASAVVVVLALVVVWRVARDGDAAASSAPVSSTIAPEELARRAGELLQAGNARQAVALVEDELATRAKPVAGRVYLVLGHARSALGRRLDALAAYEMALAREPELARDAELRASLVKALEAKEALTVVLALDLLASMSPPAHDDIVTYAAKGAVIDGRRRAAMLAQRDGVDAELDRVASAILDLQQATTCEERKAAIEKLGVSMDRRALPALKRVRSVKCVERAAADAIARIEAPN